MKVAGFTFIRNALLYDYPVVEAITSILPVCDFFMVAVGKSDDETQALIRNIDDPRIHILESEWDDSLRDGGRVLAVETNKAFQAIPPEYDWCFYIQADECVHEHELPAIRRAMERYLNDRKTEGLLFRYRHFYGSYDYTGASRRWYRQEVRIIRNDKNIRSYRDAQGFRWSDGRKLRVRFLDAWMHHYGWVRHPEALHRKQISFNRLWNSAIRPLQPDGPATVYEYNDAEPLEPFRSGHPAVMQPRINAMNWTFSGDPTAVRWGMKDRVSRFIEKLTGWRPGEYRNFKLIK